MLSLPGGIRRSVSVHNINAGVYLDWLEGTVLLDEDELSQTDIVGYLIEEQIYDDQDFALEFVLPSWSLLERRLSWVGEYSPIRFHDRYMTRELDWQEIPAHSYCLVVSLGPFYDGWTKKFGNDYSEQGRLFELITKSAMEAQFSGWQFTHTGWRRDSASKLPAVVESLVSMINERIGNLDDYASQDANEAGVDLVWNLPLGDRRPGAPVYLAQYASGLNWPEKINEPNLAEWQKIIDFAAIPNKAFSLPLALDDRELRRQSNNGRGLLLDRYRLLARARPECDWVPGELRGEIVAWLEPRIDWIMSR